MSTERVENINNDVLTRRVTRFLLIFQASALFIDLILIIAHLSSIALFLTFISLILILGAIVWFYIRYRSYSIIQERIKINQLAKSLQAQILAHTTNIQLTHENRERIQEAERTELSTALVNLQNKYIQSGMASTLIAGADIPGIGPGLKQRLSAHGITSAASITPNVTNVEGFGPAKTQEILDWQRAVSVHFIRTKPTDLPFLVTDEIKKKFQIHHANNDAEEHKAQETKSRLEKARDEIQPRINQLAPFTFMSFLRHGLAAQGIMAAIFGTFLITSHLFMGAGALFGAVRDSIPTATFTPTRTLTPTITLTSTITDTPTITLTPTITDTPTITLTPTNTFTSSFTLTPSRTYTPTRTPTQTPSITLTRTVTRTPGPYVPPVIPGGIFGNPWGYNFETGNVIYSPPSNFCNYFPCILSFGNGSGYVIECADGKFSKSGGRPGACSQHGGYSRTLFSH